MEYLPVGKRTRSQRAKMLMEKNKKARLAAKREWKKKKEEMFEGKVGIKDEILEEGSEAMVIDEEEFLKGVKFNESEKNSQIQDLGVVKKEVFDYDDDDNGDDGNGGMMFDNDVNDGDSDDSLQILGEKWNPLGLDDAYDDDDDDGDGDGDGEDVHDDGCHPLAVEISSDDNDNERDGVKEGEYCEVKDDDGDDDDDSDDDDGEDDNDDDFVGKDDEPSSSSDEYSSSACSVIEVDENDNVLLNDDDDDGHDNDYDDDEEDGVCKSSHKNEKRENIYDNVRKLRHNNKIKERFYESELKKNVSIEKEAEEVEKVSVEKRKRGRPRKNKSLAEAEAESSQSRNKVKKPTKEKELQKIILNSILEGECKRIDENLADSTDFYLPLKFQFGVEKLDVHKKTEDELEVDEMFKELDFSLQACNICATSEYDYDGDSEAVPPDDALSQEDCAKGKHCLILDDEIGLICKFCSYVNLEIRHVMPDFNNDPFRRGSRRDNGKFLNEYSMAGDGFQFPDSSHDREGDHLSPPADDVQGTVWDLVPGVKRGSVPLTSEGFEFIWKNIAGGIKIDELGKAAASGLGGCIICHAPGTGKTRLATVFLHSFMKQYEMASPLIIALLHARTWEEEFGRWKVDIPFFNLNEDYLSGKEDPKFLTQAGNTRNLETVRSIKLSTWASGKGVLGVSYQLFRELAGDEKKGTSKKVREILLKKPGVVVMDEGHTARNEKSKIWKAVFQTSTKRRVILSGTPFQNNFEELHNTLALVREKIGTPILSAYYEQDDRRIQELKKRIKPFVHVHNGEILREKLKGLFHSLIILKPSNLQKRCFQHLPRINNALKRDNLVSITSVHPSILCYENVNTSTLDDVALMDVLEKHKMDLDAGVKIRFLIELIKMSKGERVLVFGQFIPPLDFIADLLTAVLGWNKGSEFLYMRGSRDMKERQSMIRLFNDPKSEARVLLASIKACSEGIHLVGASRVVLLDVVWNPSVERQAISRAYRLGQEKDVFVYHLITSGTLEEAKYHKQATKERLSELMFSSEESMEKMGASLKISEDHVLEEMIHHEKMKHLFAKIIRQPKFDKLIKLSMDP